MKVNPLALTILALAAAGCARRGIDKPRIGFALREFDDPFRSGVRRAVETESVGRAELSVADALLQQSVQDGQIDAFIEGKSRSLAVDLAAPASAASVIARAKEAKTPVVFLGRRPDASDMTSWDKAYYVGTSPEQSGASAGAILARAWKADPSMDRNGDGELGLAFLGASPEKGDSARRLEGALAALKSSGVGARRLDGSPARSAGREAAGSSSARAAALLAGLPGLEAVLCDDAALAMAAIETLAPRADASGGAAAAAKGAAPVPVVAAGSSAAALEAIEKGRLMGAVADDAREIGAAAFRLALVLARGQDASAAGYAISEAKYVWIPCRGITAANVADGKYR